MAVRSLGFRTDLMIRQLAGSSVSDLGDHLVVRTPSNPAYHWGNFILVLAEAADAARWLAAFRAAHPDARHVAIGLDVAEVDEGLRGAYAGLVLELDVSQVLAAPSLNASSLSAPPRQIECRALATDDEWAQMLEVTLVTHEITDPVEVEFATRKQAELRRLVADGHGAWFGAFVDGRVCGSLGVLTDGSGLGRYQSVETHPSFRRRGLARAMITTAGEHMRREFGVTELVIVADPEYHAISLYRSVGFAPVEIQVQVGLLSD